MYPEYPVEVLLVHAKEVAIVLSENNGGRPRGVCNQGQLPKVVPLMERTHHTLRPRHNYGYMNSFLNTTTSVRTCNVCVTSTQEDLRCAGSTCAEAVNLCVCDTV